MPESTHFRAVLPEEPVGIGSQSLATRLSPTGSWVSRGRRRRRLQARARTRNRREPHRTRLVGFSAKAAVAELERAMTTGSKRETAAQADAAREAAYLERVETSKRAAAELLAAEIAARGPPEATGT